MQKSLVPELTPLVVSPSLLLLDPNNPRLHTHQDELISEKKYEDFEVQKATFDRMNDDRFRISELIEGIKQNGFIPVDHIFVKRIGTTKRFLVLEGNRRVTAIKSILAEFDKDREKGKPIDEELQKQLSQLTVMQIVDKGPEKIIREKITYLLGVRHHGSLRKWSSFARARDIFQKYLFQANQTVDSFQWDEDHAESIAKSLSLTVKDIELSLRTFVAMAQLANHPPVKATKHGILPRWFSLFRDSLQNKKLYSYLKQDEKTFLLSDECVSRYDNLCRFSDVSGQRNGAAIKTPQEWSKLGQLLEGADATPAQREENLRLVEEEGMQPSVVHAKHKSAVSRLSWGKWLENVYSIVSDVTMADDMESQAAREMTTRLVAILQELERRDIDLVGGAD